MRLYHGTSSDAAEKIQTSGFKIKPSKHTLLLEDCIYFSDTCDYAAQHGTVVCVEIDSKYVELYQENPLSADDYGYIPGDEHCVSQDHLSKITII